MSSDDGLDGKKRKANYLRELIVIVVGTLITGHELQSTMITGCCYYYMT